MSSEERSRHERIYLIVITCTLTLVLFYIIAPSNKDNKTQLSQDILVLNSETFYSDGSKSESPDSDSPDSNSPDSDSPNLKPPSQVWAHNQFTKAMSYLGWKYIPPNDWGKCTPRTYYFPNINTMFTGIPKTGCSNWLIALLEAEGELNKSVNPSKVAWVHGGSSGRHRIGNMVQVYNRSVLNNAFGFTVVRNPWTRMVSGYRQKLSSEDTQGGSFKGMRMNIVKEIRGINNRKELEKSYPTFEEFVRYLIKQAGSIDRHFALQTRELCIPHAMYDFIVPLEYSATLSQEVWSKIKGTGPSLLGSYDKASDPRLQSSALYAKKWLSEMDPKLIEQVYEIYEVDFLLMNYSNFTHPDFPLPLHSPIL